MKTPISIIDFANSLAHEDDHKQGEFINNFGAELFIACKGQSNFEQQICFISSKLSQSGIRLIKELAAFIELREKEHSK